VRSPERQRSRPCLRQAQRRGPHLCGRLWVDGPGGAYIRHWYTATQAGCAAGGTCSVTPSTALAASGAHKWWIQTWNTAGNGPYSSRGDFTVSTSVPAAPTLICPIGGESSFAPTQSLTETGAHKWWVKGWNPTGHGPYSARGDFTRTAFDDQKDDD